MSDVILSSIVESQLPEFIREEHQLFAKFIKRYYEWLEKNGNIVLESKKLDDAKDVDLADNVYIEQIRKEIAPFFPQELLLDKAKFLKIVGEFYRSKGTPESVKFLFRVLYNEEITISYPKEQVLRTSDGKWVLPLALRVTDNDPNILEIEQTKIIGQTSKATAIVEKAIKSVDRQLGIEYVELYISNITKLFSTGETVTTHVTGNTQIQVSATLIGSLSEIKIDPINRGLYYNGYDPELGYDGDPVTIVGGLNPQSANPVGALATVGTVLRGSVKNIITREGGFGFRYNSIAPNSSIIDFKGGFTGGLLGSEAKAFISLLDENYTRNVNVSDVTIETVYSQSINQWDNTSNTKTIGQVTTYQDLGLYSIAYVDIESQGGGYRQKPEVDIYSMYLEDSDDLLVITSCTAVKGSRILRDSSQDLTDTFEVGEKVKLFLKNRFEEIRTVTEVTSETITLDIPFENNIDNLMVYKLLRKNLDALGSLGRIEVLNGGQNYNVGEYLIFTSTGGRGLGANAQITEVHAANNGVKVVEFNEKSVGALTGVTISTAGTGYGVGNTFTATGGTGTSAVLTVLAVNGSGNVTSVNVSNSGKYITSPTTTLNPFTSNTGSGSGFRANLTISYAPENIRGGEGYDAAHLPLITINTISGTGASLIAKEILGDGEELELSTTRIGSISSLRVISYGYDYIASPQISLRNADLIVSNVTEGQIFVANTKIYQGTSNTNTTFVAYVDRYVSTNNHMRIYNYSGTFNVATQIISNDNTVSANVVTISYYGDGKAKATAGFENGLIRYPGIYLNEDGQLSADKKLQDSKKYHNFSYVINTENDYVKFKKALNDVVHPVGTKTFVNRISANEASAARPNNTTILISVQTLGNTFNISNGSNSMVATGASSNLLSIISVGDYVTLTSVERRISGTVNIGASSNVIVGTSTNFINDVQANDVIKLSTGNTSTVTEVINANTIYTYTNFGISNNTANISLLFNDTKQVTFVNANTILVSTNFTTNSTFVVTYHQKLE
jgi:hypothetical protein